MQAKDAFQCHGVGLKLCPVFFRTFCQLFCFDMIRLVIYEHQGVSFPETAVYNPLEKDFFILRFTRQKLVRPGQKGKAELSPDVLRLSDPAAECCPEEFTDFPRIRLERFLMCPEIPRLQPR